MIIHTGVVMVRCPATSREWMLQRLNGFLTFARG